MDPARPDRPGVSPIGLAMIGSEMVGFAVTGVVIDLLAGTMPWVTIILTLLGLLAAFLHLVRLAQKGAQARKGPPGGS